MFLSDGGGIRVHPSLPPSLQIPYSVVFTKVDKRKKDCPAAVENIEAFQQASNRDCARGVGHGSSEGFGLRFWQACRFCPNIFWGGLGLTWAGMWH